MTTLRGSARTTRATRAAALGAALALSFTLAACGGGDDEPAATEPAASDEMTDEPTESTTGSGAGEAMGAGDQAFGPGCSAVPASGAGSFDGMAVDPVATAASNNPLLTTLVTAVGEAGLVDTLNSADALTVFAPTDDAFAKIPEQDLDAVLADKELLTTVLTHHVVAGQLDPENVAGRHETLAGDTIGVKGSGEEFTVGKEKAAVLCGNIPTANATVYVIDTVLMP